MTTKDKIKAVALSHFAKTGYEGTSLSVITKEVGVTTPAIYAFFGGKEDLFLTIFEEVLEHHFQAIKQTIDGLEGSSVDQKLYQILHRAVLHHLQNEEEVVFYKRAMMFPPASLEPKLRERFSATEDLLAGVLRSIFEEGMAQGVIRKRSLDDLLDAFLCLMDGVFLQMFYYDTKKYEAKLQTIWNVFWSGITVNG
jgi:AcrR family transcriptional regulator